MLPAAVAALIEPAIMAETLELLDAVVRVDRKQCLQLMAHQKQDPAAVAVDMDRLEMAVVVF